MALPPSAEDAQRGSAIAGIVVEEAIADKPINVFGVRYGRDCRHLVQSLTNLYGLQMLVGDHQQFEIVAPRRRTINGPEDVPAEIQRLLPLSLMRALDAQTDVLAGLRRTGYVAKSADANAIAAVSERGRGREIALARRERRRVLLTSTGAYYFPAVRRLMALTEPRVPNPDSAAVPVNAFGSEAERLIALIMTADGCLQEVDSLRSFVPSAALLQPDQARIQMTASIIDGRMHFYINVSHQVTGGNDVPDAMEMSLQNVASP